MRSHQLEEDWYMLVFDTGDEVLEKLKAFARENELWGASFQAVGAFSDVTLGFFDLAARDYRRNHVAEQVEVAALVGNVGMFEGEPKVHAHVVVGREDGTAMAGHLLGAHVRPTLELFLQASPVKLNRRMDQTTGLPLFE